jgi:hypothetical protein
MPPKDAVETQTGFVWLRRDGIVQTANKSPREQTLEDARENVRAIAQVGGGVPRPLLVDSSIPAPLSRECQAYYVSDEAARYVSAVAIVVDSWFGRFVGNLMLGRGRADVPSRLFENEREATRWLRAYSALLAAEAARG